MVHGLKVCQVTELTVCCSPRHKHTTSLLAATPSASRPCGPFSRPPFKSWTTDYQTHGSISDCFIQPCICSSRQGLAHRIRAKRSDVPDIDVYGCAAGIHRHTMNANRSRHDHVEMAATCRETSGVTNHCGLTGRAPPGGQPSVDLNLLMLLPSASRFTVKMEQNEHKD